MEYYKKGGLFEFKNLTKQTSFILDRIFFYLINLEGFYFLEGNIFMRIPWANLGRLVFHFAYVGNLRIITFPITLFRYKRRISFGFLIFLYFIIQAVPVNASESYLDLALKNTYKHILEGPGVFNHGSRKIYPPGFTITTDLCPSTKPWNRGLYEKLVSLGEKLGKPIPVGIAISGSWMKRYPIALHQLIKWNNDRKLDITWINHSDTHPVKGNFLVNPKINFTKEAEVQANRMRRAGILNSPYFRFPGLIFNSIRLRQLSKMGYIAVGADAWLAKGQPVRNGSIILVHGNGNEKYGVKLLIMFLDRKEKEILAGKLRILSLDELLFESMKIDPKLHFISWDNTAFKQNSMK